MNILHSGSCGDIIYSLPFIKEYVKDKQCTLFINNNTHYQNAKNGYYDLLKDLLLQQSYIENVVAIENVPPQTINYDYFYNAKLEKQFNIDVNLNKFRIPSEYFSRHYSQLFFDVFNFPHNNQWESKWLTINDTKLIDQEYSIVCRSMRYRNSSIDIKKIIESMPNPYFVGLDDEYNDMKQYVDIKRFEITNLLQLSQLINHAEKVFSNATAAFAITVGLDHKYKIYEAGNYQNLAVNVKELYV